MYLKNNITKTSIDINDTQEGETIEMKIERIVDNKEPITDGAPVIYTERKDGVKPEYDIRTDKQEIAIEATNYIAKSKIAKRQEIIKEMHEKQKGNEEKNSGTEANSDTSN